MRGHFVLSSSACTRCESAVYCWQEQTQVVSSTAASDAPSMLSTCCLWQSSECRQRGGGRQAARPRRLMSQGGYDAALAASRALISLTRLIHSLSVLPGTLSAMAFHFSFGSIWADFSSAIAASNALCVCAHPNVCARIGACRARVCGKECTFGVWSAHTAHPPTIALALQRSTSPRARNKCALLAQPVVPQSTRWGLWAAAAEVWASLGHHRPGRRRPTRLPPASTLAPSTLPHTHTLTFILLATPTLNTHTHSFWPCSNA